MLFCKNTLSFFLKIDIMSIIFWDSLMKITIYFLLFSSFLLAGMVDIKAGHFYANDMAKEAIFSGGVRVVEGVNRFNSSMAKVNFDDNRKAKKLEATGSVNFDITHQNIHYKGSCQKLIYQPVISQYYFEGNVFLQDLTNNRTIKSHSTYLNTKTGIADIKGNKNPVHFIFEIED